jgi:Family of unknown function (DUF5996)
MDEWPALPYEEWRETLDTLHMYTQVIGKVRLALSPLEPQWANVPLYVTARGLSTSPVPFGLRTLDAEFDLISHSLVLRTSDGGTERVELSARPVADFYRDVMDAFARLSLDVTISGTPSEVSDPIPFAVDRTHHSYDSEQAGRFFRVLSQVDVVLKEHRAPFPGRTSPVHFFWGTFDLAVTRYSGRPATPPPGAGSIYRRGADAEQICAGFWPGDDRFPRPAFFAYAYPKPEGVENIAIAPEGASWDATVGEFILPYDAVRASTDPRADILAFLDSTYHACAGAAAWSDVTPTGTP